MKKVLIVFLSFSMLCLLTACEGCKKKDGSPSGPITIGGQVVDKNTHTPVAGAEVDLIERDGGIFGGGTSQTIQRMYADADGKFAFKNVAINSQKTYTVLGNKNLYFNDGNNTTDVDIANPANVVVPMQPMAWLKLHIKNTIPYDEFDMICFGTPGGAGHYGGVSIDLDAPISTEEGNTDVNLYYSMIKNRDISGFHYKIYCPAFDTTLYQLNY